MTLDARWPARAHILFWCVAFAGLVWLVIDRFDLTTVWIEVTAPDGAVVRMANGWATVDHPFHIARAEQLLDSLRDGELPRWLGQHQGGYPAEFYPLGAAWLDAAIWTVAFGQLPLAVIHKILIALIVLAPAGIYLWWARRDRLSPGVALLAGSGHVVIAGEWWSGGWTEVALWGLVTNVAAQTAILGALAGTIGWIAHGRYRDLGIATLAAGLALGTNPRTGLGLAAVIVAAMTVALLPPTLVSWRSIARRTATLGALFFASAAPVLIPLIRYRDLYYFVHYTGYADLAAWWSSSQIALWQPIFWLSLAGLVLGLVRPGRLVTRTAAVTALLYMGMTALLVVAGGGIVEQLELTRLMPLQRMLLFYLAAIAVHDGIELFVSLVAKKRVERVSGRPAEVICGLGLAAAAAVLIWIVAVRPAGFVPEEQRGLRSVPSSAHAANLDLEAAVRDADDRAHSGTAILLLGSALQWHQVLNAPIWSERRFFYDDWLWYWQRDHAGPYNPSTEHAYPVDAAALTIEYLRTHGIGAVVVTDAPGQSTREAARDSDLLTLIRSGAWYDVFLVNDPTPIVTSGNQAAGSIEITNHHIETSGSGSGDSILVRHNWHPRWRAVVNGEPARIEKRSDGYMSVAAPSGDYELDLRYTLTRLDWLARALFASAAIATVALIAGAGDRFRPAKPSRESAR